MSDLEATEVYFPKVDSGESLGRRLKDYSQTGMDLVTQRQAIFGSATLLTALYYDPWVSLICYLAVVITEIFDFFLFRRVLEIDEYYPKTASRFLFLYSLSTVASAGSISAFVIAVAMQQETGVHFTPLFFLFAAGLFAAINNHQVITLLTLRLSIYGAAFFFVLIRSIVVHDAPLGSQHWLQLFTGIFVVYFILDCSRIFMMMYRRNFNQMNSLRLQHEKAQVALRAKSQFLSTVSHELRTPLTCVKSTLDLIGTGALGAAPDKMNKALEIAHRNAKSLAELIDDLLDVQSLDSGEFELQVEPVELLRLAQEIKEKIRPFASDIEVAVNMSSGSEGIWVQADRKRLAQVISNVLSNACKHSPRGASVEISVDARDGHARIDISDKGPGIPPDKGELVFGRFTQLDSSDTRRTSGTGLGLNISKSIIDRHGGSIDYASGPEGGTIFTIFLPLPEWRDQGIRKETNRVS